MAMGRAGSRLKVKRAARIAIAFCVLGFSGLAVAQHAETPGMARDGADVPVNAGPGQEIHTLHVYANLIQIPVLVLGPRREAIAPVAANRFRVSIDGGPQYKVTHVRMEGDDPISLGILLDLRGSQDELMKKMGEALAGLAPGSLHPKDHVSIYALGCKLERSVDDKVANKAVLRGGVDALLQERTKWKQERPKPDCKDGGHLWDSLGVVIEGLSQTPGRRVILVVTDGEDRGSRSKWNQIIQFAQSKGVAVFGIEDQMFFNSTTVLRQYMQYGGDSYDSLCQLSGGLVMWASPDNLAAKLAQFVTMVRGRYIVEFPRPYNSTAGSHNLAITIQKSDNFVRSAGISVPIADPAVMADPTTVPSDPSQTPQEGKRRGPQKP